MNSLFGRVALLTICLASPAAILVPMSLDAEIPSGDAARVPVEALSAGLLAIMKGGKAMGVRGRAVAIAPVIDRSYDVPLMARLTIGPAWTTIAPADQAALVAAFRRMIIGQYAVNFSDWSGERIVTAPLVEARGGDRLVRTAIESRGEAPVAIAYRLRVDGAGWRIIDVFYNNAISQLAVRRADFARVLASGGARALTRHLDALADKAGS